MMQSGIQWTGFILLICLLTCGQSSPSSEDSEIESTNTTIEMTETEFMRSGSTIVSNNTNDVKFIAFTKKMKRGLEVAIGDEGALEEAGFQKGAPLVMVVHGYMVNISDVFVLVRTYRDYRPDFNLIAVDWYLLTESIISVPILNIVSYVDALKNVPIVAGAIVPFIEFMVSSGYVSGPESVHMIGHSLGAHVIGSTGYLVKQKMGTKLGRLTGVDPAGPFMKLLKPKDRMSESKATFVDNVHTQIELFGTPVPLGHVDFYPNGGKGKSQKECLEPDHIFSLSNNQTIGCTHHIGLYYYARSIKGEQVFACPCRRAKLPSIIPCPKPKLNCKSPAVFGEAVNQKTRGKFYLTIGN